MCTLSELAIYFHIAENTRRKATKSDEVGNHRDIGCLARALHPSEAKLADWLLAQIARSAVALFRIEKLPPMLLLLPLWTGTRISSLGPLRSYL